MHLREVAVTPLNHNEVVPSLNQTFDTDRFSYLPISGSVEVISAGRLSKLLPRQNVTAPHHTYRGFAVTTADGQQKLKSLIGKRGAHEQVITPPANQGEAFSESPDTFHKIDYRLDLATLVGTIGSQSFLLGDDGRIISDPFQSFSTKRGKFYGKNHGPGKDEVIFKKPSRDLIRPDKHGKWPEPLVDGPSDTGNNRYREEDEMEADRGLADVAAASWASSPSLTYYGSTRARIDARRTGDSGRPVWMEPFAKVDMFGEPTVFNDDYARFKRQS